MSLLRDIIKNLFYLFFVLNGRKPWSRGYNSYKYKKIRGALLEGEFNGKALPPGYGFRIDERIIEYPWFMSRIPAGKGNLLDAGSTLNFDFILSWETIAEKTVFISTLAPERNCFWRKNISYVYGDLRDTCYKNSFFDWVVSISTIEHIGFDNTMLYTRDMSKKENDPHAYLEAIKEFHRILKPGGTLYLTLPFGKFKNHGWFQVFNSKMLDSLINVFAPASLTESLFRYKSDGWHASSREDSKDASCFDIHKQKHYDKDFAAFSRAVVCLEMVK